MSRNSRIKNIKKEILVSYAKDLFNDYDLISSQSLNEIGTTAICKLKFIESLENLYHNPHYIKVMAKATYKNSSQIREELIEEIRGLKRIIRFRNKSYSEKIKQKYYSEQEKHYPISLFNLLTLWEQRFGVDYFLISLETDVSLDELEADYKLSGIFDDDINLFIDTLQIEREYQLFFGIEDFDDDFIFENEFLIKKIICERILIDYFVKKANKTEGLQVEKLLKKYFL